MRRAYSFSISALGVSTRPPNAPFVIERLQVFHRARRILDKTHHDMVTRVIFTLIVSLCYILPLTYPKCIAERERVHRALALHHCNSGFVVTSTKHPNKCCSQGSAEPIAHVGKILSLVAKWPSAVSASVHTSGRGYAETMQRREPASAAPAQVTAADIGESSATDFRTSSDTARPFWRRWRRTQRSHPPSAPIVEPVVDEKDVKPDQSYPFKLKFAASNVRFHPEDLPYAYEPADVYRGLDEYIHARRAARHAQRRAQRRIDLGKDSDDDSDDSSSSSSSGPQVISRLRAFFADSSDSDSETSSSESQGSAASETTRKSTDADGRSPVNQSRRDLGVSPAFSPWTPRLSAFTPGRRRRRRRRMRRSGNARRAHNDPHMITASRRARRNARRLRELAGGVTQYMLYTPMRDNHDRLLKTQSWNEVEQRFIEYFTYHAQIDGHAGDLGMPIDSGMSSFFIQPTPQVPHDSDSVAGDLALPPPALEFDESQYHESHDLDREHSTGLHMSDVPLTPFYRASSDSGLSPMPFSVPSTPMGRFGPNIGEATPRRRVPTIPEEPQESSRHVASTPDLDALQLPEAALDVDEPAERAPLSSVETSLRSHAWWLDIHCPTYKDMQELSLHFPLHPLTVEDILKQEPREKYEVYERLGYYFIVLRAIDENYFRLIRKGKTEEVKDIPTSPGMLEKRMENNISERVHIEIVKSAISKDGLEGLGTGFMSMYLVVFAHGVLSFHFEDVTKHTEHVRQRLGSKAISMNHSPDWIVHKLYDSIVDAYTPYISFLMHEVAYIESLSNDESLSPFGEEFQMGQTPPFFKRWYQALQHYRHKKSKAAKGRQEVQDSSEKQAQSGMEKQSDELGQENGLDTEEGEESSSHQLFSTAQAVHQSLFIRKIARAREIVTGLTRLLSPKPDVLRALHKRLGETFYAESDDMILVYFDDVYDHVASMLAQLAERESALSHTLSSFLSRASMANGQFQVKQRTFVFVGSSIATIVFLCTFCTSFFSMNVYVPDSYQDEDFPEDKLDDNLHTFGGLVVFIISLPFLFMIFYYFLAKRAKKKNEQIVKSR